MFCSETTKDVFYYQEGAYNIFALAGEFVKLILTIIGFGILFF